MGLYTVRELSEVTGIDLRGDDGQPFHCGKRMEVRGGIIGPDYARCHACGLEIGNTLSPHISGWAVMEEGEPVLHTGT